VDANSPRTQQVMNKLGLVADDVSFKAQDEFMMAGMLEEMGRKRHRLHLRRVFDNIKEVTKDRKQLIFVQRC
jgi:hypothetical protein